MKGLKAKIVVVLLALVAFAIIIFTQETLVGKLIALGCIVAGLFVIFALIKFGIYLFSPYFKSTKDSYFKVLFNREKALRYKISQMFFKKFSGVKRCVCDLYMPKADGGVCKADLVLLNETGIWVIDTKHINGKISGTKTDEVWKLTKKGVTTDIPNPAAWNQLYSKWLKAFAKNCPTAECYSNVIYNNGCNISEVKILGNDVAVTKMNGLKKELKVQLNRIGTTLAESEVLPLYEELLKLRDPEAAKKVESVPGIQETIFFGRNNNRFEEIHAPEVGQA